ncbi:MAG: acyl-CoA thioesterase, partial [Muribaculaceae bacterium]|nr:acyl-CoA thioesterase [Muribaculaceae bacterium]
MANNDRLFKLTKPFLHFTRIQPRFGDYDIFGHVNNNNVLAYFDLGKIDYTNRFIGKRLTPREVGVVVVNINIDFLAPAEIGRELEVATTVIRLSERSVTLYQRLLDSVTDDVLAQATTVLAGFDP